ncbi:hypothetical protein J2Z66_004339 [Paenibacillus eucommiae]|uniref:Uncharacterized protein n=1 Tax=Paenibacillus eucommiae TaxID=1355755 RepID=A0ABS4J0T1_9BACL|nr:hypothetical protein [Paenibacillus eucommiae]
MRTLPLFHPQPFPLATIAQFILAPSSTNSQQGFSLDLRWFPGWQRHWDEDLRGPGALAMVFIVKAPGPLQLLTLTMKNIAQNHFLPPAEAIRPLLAMKNIINVRIHRAARLGRPI